MVTSVRLTIMMKCKEVTCTTSPNIAVIKYWGKRDEELILPTNSSLSVTLSQDDLHTKTSIRASSEFNADRLWLNGVEEDLNRRLLLLLEELRKMRKTLIEDRNTAVELPLSQWKLHIASVNNFPTAAGLASSASGYSCLVYALVKLFALDLTPAEISILARRGSGSACRSVMGGYVAWEMGTRTDGSDSMAVQIAPETHWTDMCALILVVNDAKKGVSSTTGMQTTVNTSTLYKERINTVVPQRMTTMKQAILNRDFDTFAEITMKDSNSFHAVCLDTSPPIFYLNDTSRMIISLITRYNELSRQNGQGYKAAYTFDAGPNAVIYVLRKHVGEILEVVNHFFPGVSVNGNLNDTKFKLKFDALEQLVQKMKVPVMSGALKRIIVTKVGDGPRVLATEWEPDVSLFNKDGTPKLNNADQ